MLFNMLILGSITDHSGYVWLKSKNDLYIVESMPVLCKKTDMPRHQIENRVRLGYSLSLDMGRGSEQSDHIAVDMGDMV